MNSLPVSAPRGPMRAIAVLGRVAAVLVVVLILALLLALGIERAAAQATSTVTTVTADIEARFRRDDSLAAWGVRDSALIADAEAAFTGWSAQLAAVPPASLPDAAARSRLAALRGFVDAATATNSCRFDLWNVDQLFGFHIQFAQSVASAPLGSDAARQRLLRSANRFPIAVRWQIANLQAGVAAGFTAPRANVDRVVEQLDGMLAAHGAALLAPLARDSSPSFAAAWRALVRDSLAPALKRYRDYLAPAYVAKARAEPGLTALPNGPACYAAIVYQATTMKLNLDSLYAVAVAKRIETLAEIGKVGQQMFGASMSTLDILRKARTDPQFVMRDPDSIMAAYTRTVVRARALLPLQFALTPDAPLVIRATPKEQAAAAAPARYLQAPDDGSAPAVFVVNAYQPGGIAVMNIELGTAHEAYPGHHFQFVYAAQRRAAGGAPDFLSNGAYLEGWGIYAERLADEAGLYDQPITRLGYLIHRLDVYMALQCDLGIHALGWSRQQAIDTMMAVAGRPLAQAASYADRHAASAGQLATYGVGYLAITGAREKAEKAMGKRFDLKGFHAVVLGDPGVTLPELERLVAEWSAATAAAAP